FRRSYSRRQGASPWNDLSLSFDKIGYPCASQLQQFGQSRITEGISFCCSLDLDEFALIGHDEVEVDVRCRVLRVVEVEHRHAAHDTDADSRNVRPYRILRQLAGSAQSFDCKLERYKRTGDR